MPKQTPLKEIEIKLYISDSVMHLLRNSELIIKHSQRGWRKKELFNQYIDTKDHDLITTKVVLRVRKDGHQYIQTLKTKGQSVGGVSTRNEFDWIVQGPQLDLSVLNDKYWPNELEKLDKTKLGTLFSTDFTRDYILIDWLKNEHATQIEVALDKGLIKAGGKSEIINELELELKTGEADALLDFAINLAKMYPLVPSDTSKAERGYRLVSPDRYEFSIPMPPADKGLPAQIRYYLGVSQRLLESYLWQPNKVTILAWFEHLQQLAEFLRQAACNELLLLLDGLLSDWQLMISRLDETRLLEQAKLEINKTRWGIFSLSTSRWLLNRT